MKPGMKPGMKPAVFLKNFAALGSLFMAYYMLLLVG